MNTQTHKSLSDISLITRFQNLFKLYCPECKRMIKFKKSTFYQDGISTWHYKDGQLHACLKFKFTEHKDRNGNFIYDNDRLRIPVKRKTDFHSVYLPVEYIVVYDQLKSSWIAEQVEYDSTCVFQMPLEDCAGISRVV